MRVLIGLKKNMSQIFASDGTIVPVTYVDLQGVVIAGFKTQDKDGYDALLIGFGKKKHPTKAEIGKFKQLGFVPSVIKESKIDIKGFAIQDVLKPSIFKVGDKVTVTGVNKGKGFQGVVKRWGFKGGPHTHGQSDRERHPGAIGMRTTPGRVFRGKKMAGRMGGVTTTVKNLKVVLVDDETNLIGLKGAVPGNKNSLIVIKAQ